MIAHLRAHFPAQLAHFDGTELAGQIDGAIRRAAGLGIVLRGDVAHYLNLCAAAGWDFQTRAEYSRIAEVLSSPALASASLRVAAACEMFQAMLERNEQTGRAWALFHELSRARTGAQ